MGALVCRAFWRGRPGRGYCSRTAGRARARPGRPSSSRGGAADNRPAKPRELTVDLAWPWRGLPSGCNILGLGGLSKKHDRPGPPWPDVLVSCSRRAGAIAVAVRRASRGKTLAVHVQDPLTRASAFDLVVAMAHDRVIGPNVIKTPTALHDVTPERLAAAAATWRGRLGEGGQPGWASDPRRSEQASADVRRRRGALASTGWTGVPPADWGLGSPSPPRGARRARSRPPSQPGSARTMATSWDMQGDNPYLGILALAGR